MRYTFRYRGNPANLIQSENYITYYGSGTDNTADVLPGVTSFRGRSVLVMPLVGACCKLRWCEPAKARVWSRGVVVDAPGFDDPASLGEIGEQMFR